jgi:hypothetical protein
MKKSRLCAPKRRPWTEHDLDVLRRCYPTMKSEAIATCLGRKIGMVYQKSAKLGLKKSAEFLASDGSGRLTKLSASGAAFRYPKGHVPANAGLRRPGWAPGRMSQTQFKKGRPASESRNYKPIGALRVSADGMLERKVSDDPKIVPARRWIGVHRMVWAEAHGAIPDGHAVVFKPGRATADLESITLDAIELVTRAELMRRNSYHTNYPPEIRQVIQLRGAVNRQINKRSQHAKQD